MSAERVTRELEGQGQKAIRGIARELEKWWRGEKVEAQGRSPWPICFVEMVGLLWLIEQTI